MTTKPPLTEFGSIAPSDSSPVVGQIQPLILAGGLSSRMGQPKHLMVLPNGDTLLEHTLGQIILACPWVDTVYVSLRHTDTRREWSSPMVVHDKAISMIPVYDEDVDGQPDHSGSQSQGPAAGMIAAHRIDPEATFLVVACDFPLIDSVTVEFLLSSFHTPITCYQNDQGFVEPLLALWSPEALVRLSQNVSAGSFSPRKVVEQLSGRLISAPPGKESCLQNTNTPAEWRETMKLASQAT